MDLELRHGMYEFLRELNKSGVTIILTTHYLEEAESLCRNIAIIDHGTIVKYGTIKDLLASMEDEVISLDLDREYVGVNLEKYNVVTFDNTIDITVSSENTLDNAIAILQADTYKIRSIKPKSGRLEEFFLKSTKK